MRRETVLTTGIINCLMFFNCVFLIPASVAFTPLPLLASFSKRFCAPFLARWRSCFAIVASVRFDEGTILTGFLCRGLFLRPPILPGVEDDGEAGASEESWSAAPSSVLSKGESRARAASALSRSEEGGRPRLRWGTPGNVLSRDLRGESFVDRSLFRLLPLDTAFPPLGSFPTESSLLFFPSSSSVSSSVPECLSSKEPQDFLFEGGRPLLFSPAPGGLPGSLLGFSADFS